MRRPIDINSIDYFDTLRPENHERTKKRLTEIKKCGLVEFGDGSFGYPGIMSGLYIEKVWGYSDKDFNEYMDWTKELIENKKKDV